MTVPTLRSRSLSHHRLLAGLVALLVCLLPLTSLADTENDEPKSLLFGFSPYISTGPYTTIQHVRASIDTDFGIKERMANTLTNLGWMFQLGLQGPRMERIPGKPRLDISGGILIPTNASGSIGSKVVVADGNFNDKLKEESKLQVDYSNSYRAGLGVEFVVDALPVEIKVTPGVQYLYLDSRYVGRVDSERTFISEADPIIRSASTEVNLVQHFVGPSLRLATEPVKILGLEADLYLEGVLYLDVAGTRRTREERDADNRRASFNWEAATSAGLVSAGFRIRLP